MLRKYAQSILRIKLPPRTLIQNDKTHGKSVRSGVGAYFRQPCTTLKNSLLGLAGKDDFESAYLDSIADFQKDAASDFRPYIAVAMGFVQGDKEKLYKDNLLPAVDKHFPTLVELLKKSGTGFFGSSVSWVDFMIAEGLNTFYGMNPEIFEKYQELVALIKRVHNLPEIKEYVETRPKTSR